MLAFIEGPELIIVLVIVLVIFGGSQLPKLARNLGQAKKEFETGMNDKDKEASGDTSPTEKS